MTFPQKCGHQKYISMGTHEGQSNCDDPSQEELINAARHVEQSLRDKGLSQEQLKVIIEKCAIHSETAWARRRPTALEFLCGE